MSKKTSDYLSKELNKLHLEIDTLKLKVLELQNELHNKDCKIDMLNSLIKRLEREADKISDDDYFYSPLKRKVRHV